MSTRFKLYGADVNSYYIELYHSNFINPNPDSEFDTKICSVIWECVHEIDSWDSSINFIGQWGDDIIIGNTNHKFFVICSICEECNFLYFKESYSRKNPISVMDNPYKTGLHLSSCKIHTIESVHDSLRKSRG